MASKTAAPAETEAPAARSKKPLVLGALALVLVAAAAVWFLVLRAPADAEAAAEEPPEKGEVVALDPVSINLADGAYLRLGLALQQTADAAEEADGSEALDLAITTFSGRTVEELAKPEAREELKRQLLEQVERAYHDEVMDLYFTEFVTQ